MNMYLWLLVAGLSLTGCASSTIDRRRHERFAAYQALSAADRVAVDTGQITVGMPMDAVYISWGKPSQIVPGDSTLEVTWLYLGTYSEDRSFWSDYDRWHDSGYYTAPYAKHDSDQRSYVRGEVRFESGVVKEWHSLPRPGR